jgi:hypothetical protein
MQNCGGAEDAVAVAAIGSSRRRFEAPASHNTLPPGRQRVYLARGILSGASGAVIGRHREIQ